MIRTTLLLLIASAAWLSTAQATAETLRRVHLELPDATIVAEKLRDSGYDVLDETVSPQGVDIIVSTPEMEWLIASGYAPITVDVGRPFRAIQDERQARGVPVGYPDLDRITERLKAAESTFPGICRTLDLTEHYQLPPTFEGRSIVALKISDNPELDEDEPAILIVAGHHAREIVTPVLALETIRELLSGYGIDPLITDLIDGHEIWVAPVWNPDGYAYVFDHDNYWRKNRRLFASSVGVDLNRNYPWGWSSSCAGPTNPISGSYKGPEAASEPEVQTMIAFSRDRHFAKVIDYHSFGREVVYGLTGCFSHPFQDYLGEEAASLSASIGYAGDHRTPLASGEHYQWQLGTQGALAFLVETQTSFQPSYGAALGEAEDIWPGMLWWMAEHPIPIWGHVTSSDTGMGIDATIRFADVPFPDGEPNASHGAHGLYHAFPGPGVYDLIVEAEGFASVTVPGVIVSANESRRIEVTLSSGLVGVAGTEPAAGTGPRLRVRPIDRLVTFELGDATDVQLRVFGVTGSLVRTLADGPHAAGTHGVVWDGRDRSGRPAASGVYIYRLDTGRGSALRKAILLN